MTESAKEAWSEVGDRFATWGRQVVDRYHGSATDEADADETEREMKRAAKDLVDELARGFSALSDTLRDDQARKDLTDAVSAIGDAITATVEETTQSIRPGSGSSEPKEPEGPAAPENEGRPKD
jgi:hypothetical protein